MQPPPHRSLPVAAFATRADPTPPDPTTREIDENIAALLETGVEETQIPGLGGGGISMVICGLLCQVPDNRICVVPVRLTKR